MEPEATGIQFSETMAGGMMLGENDFQLGEQKARVAGHMLALHARVEIDDLERFISDPQHSGALNGTIDYPPFGEAIPGHSGRFNLFCPSDDPATKWMVYELGFEHAGEYYYFSGHKVVRDDPGMDMWSDTTTLFSRIHRGQDDSGEVVGAGILTLGPTELMKLMESMKVTGADNAIDKVGTLARFGRFFMGELWDSYSG